MSKAYYNARSRKSRVIRYIGGVARNGQLLSICLSCQRWLGNVSTKGAVVCAHKILIQMHTKMHCTSNLYYIVDRMGLSLRTE